MAKRRNASLFFAGYGLKIHPVSTATREITANVVSATKLSTEQTKALKASLKSAIGQDVQISADVDPALLGGLVVKVGSRMIDTSLRTKLNNLQFALKEVG